MSFIEPIDKRKVRDINAELMMLKGSLSDNDAKLHLANFLIANPALTLKLLTGANGKGIEMYPFQEILIKMLFEKDNCLCVMGRGTGKTVRYGSNHQYLIEKDTGIVLLKNLLPNLIFDKDEQLQDIKAINLWNGKDYQPTSKILKQSQKDCAKVITSQGYSLEGSTNHIIKVLNEDLCKIEWRKYCDLKIGDKVCIDRGEPEWELESIEDDEAYFVGLLLGDGCVTAKSYNISSADQSTISFCKQKYNCHTVPNPTDTCDSIRLNVYWSQYYKEKYDFQEEKSYTKKIPQRILKSKRALKNCLQGLFDTDGSIDERFVIDFCSTSKEMAEQVHTLLLTFGIISSIKEKDTPSDFGKAWIIYISGEDSKKFIERIGFRLSRKQNRGLKYLNQHKKINTNKDLVYGSNEELENVKYSHLKLTTKESKGLWNKSLRKRRDSQQKENSFARFNKVLNFLIDNGIEKDKVSHLLEIQDSNYFFDPITSIEYFKDDCVDFCDIPDGHAYWSNGFLSHNSTTAAWFIILYALFNPGSKIGIIGPSFRNTRKMFQEIQKIKNAKGAELLYQCITDEKCAPDVNQLKIGSSEVFALPLGSSGDKIRGYRFNVVILDEAGFVPEKIITSVIIPFLSTNIDPIKKQQTINKEQQMINDGIMKEEDRTIFKNNKFIALSSATYQFEYLYRLYKSYKDSIEHPEPNQLASYGIFQMSYEASPEGLLDRANTESAKKSFSSIEFDKEYRAIFPSDSDSFFSMKKMEAATLQIGEEPCFEIYGELKAEYLLSIDPNSLNKSSSADHFAMSVFKLNKLTKKTYLIHQFAACDLEISDYIRYIAYILQSFNIVCLTIDASGASFIQVCNDSQIFKDANLKLDFFEADFEVDEKEYIKELNKAMKSYNLSGKRICYAQQYTNDWKRTANEQLQCAIEYKRIMFASTPDDGKWQNYLDHNIANFDSLKFLSGDDEVSNDSDSKKLDFIEHQKFLIKDVKSQCCLIQLKVTEQGSHTFELPQNLRRAGGKLKVRRDSYSALFQGVYMANRYYDMMTNTQEDYGSWVPYVL